MIVRSYLLEGGSFLIVGPNGSPQQYIGTSQFVQGGCPLRLAGELRRLADCVEACAHEMGATQERRAGT